MPFQVDAARAAAATGASALDLGRARQHAKVEPPGKSQASRVPLQRRQDNVAPLSRASPIPLLGAGPARLQVGVGGWASDYSVTE